MEGHHGAFARTLPIFELRMRVHQLRNRKAEHSLLFADVYANARVLVYMRLRCTGIDCVPHAATIFCHSATRVCTPPAVLSVVCTAYDVDPILMSCADYLSLKRLTLHQSVHTIPHHVATYPCSTVCLRAGVRASKPAVFRNHRPARSCTNQHQRSTGCQSELTTTVMPLRGARSFCYIRMHLGTDPLHHR